MAHQNNMETWTPVSARLPEAGVKVLIAWGAEFMYIGVWSGFEWLNTAQRGMPDQGITHWRPLPEPPQ